MKLLSKLEQLSRTLFGNANDALTLLSNPDSSSKQYDTSRTLHNVPVSKLLCVVLEFALIGDRSGRASPMISIPDDSKTFVEHSIGLKLCLERYGLLVEVGVSGTDSSGFIGEMFGLDIVLAVECLFFIACLGVDWSDTGLDVT